MSLGAAAPLAFIALWANRNRDPFSMAGNETNLIRCTPEELLQLLQMTPRHHSLFIWGPPGIGKTELVHQFARSEGARVVTLRASEMEPQDLMGLPDLSGDFTVFKPLRYLYDLTAQAEAGRREGAGGASGPAGDVAGACGPGSPIPTSSQPTNAVLFLDELSNAHPNMVASLQYLILNRTIGFGGLELAPGVRVVAAGNRDHDGAFTTDLSTPVKSRLKHVELQPDLVQWQAWARANGIWPHIIAFLGVRERFFYDFDPRTTDHTFPCPRTWTLLSESLWLAREKGMEDPHLRRMNVEAYVGPGAAVEYAKFEEKALHCPSADDILARPDTVSTFEDRPDMAMVCVENLMEACRREPARYVDGALRYVARMHAEYQTIFHTVLMNLHGDMPEKVMETALRSPHFSTIRKNVGRLNRILGEDSRIRATA